MPFINTSEVTKKVERPKRKREMYTVRPGGVGGGVLPYMGYIGMCSPKGYGFSVFLVINRVSNLTDFGHN